MSSLEQKNLQVLRNSRYTCFNNQHFETIEKARSFYNSGLLSTVGSHPIKVLNQQIAVKYRYNQAQILHYLSVQDFEFPPEIYCVFTVYYVCMLNT